MKSSHIFWGTLFLSLGVLLLINNFFNVNLNFELIWKLAPLVLVFIGISIFIKNEFGKYAFILISAIVLSLTVFSFLSNPAKIFRTDVNFSFDSDKNGVSDSSYYSYPYSDEIKYAELIFNGAAGKFTVNSTTDKLFEANTFSEKDFHHLKVNTIDTVANIEFGLKEKTITLGNNHSNQVDFSLNSIPIWDLKFDCGAAKMDFDFSEFKVKTVDVNMGAADLELKIGELYHETKIFIDAGASSIKIKIPNDSGCELIADAVLSHKNFKGFKKIDSNKFRTENFEQSENKIFIELNCGVSSINIQRY